MRDAAIYEHSVAVTGIKRRAVSGLDSHVRITRQILSSPLRQFRLKLQTHDAPARSYHFRYDRSVVTHSASQVIHALPGLQPECLDPPPQRAWLSVIDVFCSVQGHNYVVIDLSWIFDCDI